MKNPHLYNRSLFFKDKEIKLSLNPHKLAVSGNSVLSPNSIVVKLIFDINEDMFGVTVCNVDPPLS